LEKTLVIASANPGKLIEIKAILSILDIEVVSGIDLNLHITVRETGTSYLENAQLKAEAYFQQTNLFTLADDSGLEVDILDGAPGIYSARYSPKQGANDADRRRHLLKNLGEKPEPWTAHFKCTAVLVGPAGVNAETFGRCDGIIIPEERGTGGFGYDPIFYLPEYHATMAEIPADLKNEISHRARAVTLMIPALKRVFSLDYNNPRV
jgi:XTP/dITP diphosphohydrolase